MLQAAAGLCCMTQICSGPVCSSPTLWPSNWCHHQPTSSYTKTRDINKNLWQRSWERWVVIKVNFFHRKMTFIQTQTLERVSAPGVWSERKISIHLKPLSIQSIGKCVIYIPSRICLQPIVYWQTDRQTLVLVKSLSRLKMGLCIMGLYVWQWSTDSGDKLDKDLILLMLSQFCLFWYHDM